MNRYPVGMPFDEPVATELPRHRKRLEIYLIIVSMILLIVWLPFGSWLWPSIYFRSMGVTGKLILIGLSVLDIGLLIALYVQRWRRYRRWIVTLRDSYTGTPHKMFMPSVVHDPIEPPPEFQTNPEAIDRIIEEDR